MLAAVIWYLAGTFALLSAFWLLRPARRFGIRSRRRAATALAVCLAVLAASVLLGSSERHAIPPVTLLDRFVTTYQFSEMHDVDIAAPPAQTYRALQDVTPREIRFYQVLTWIRRGGQTGPPSILNPPLDVPILKTALETSFRKLGEQPNVEIVFGGFTAAPREALTRHWTPEAFAALDDPGYAKIAMNFRLSPSRKGTHLQTETRVYATDAATRRMFTVYWRMIYPGSALIRLSWLRAIKARAER